MERQFKNLKEGDLFSYGNNYYVKIKKLVMPMSEYNVLNLETGEFNFITGDRIVKKDIYISSIKEGN